MADRVPTRYNLKPLIEAVLLIDTIEKALENGTRHYNRAGEELKTVEDILRCLKDEGELSFEYSHGF